MILARVMEEFGCHRLIYSSSATVYGIPPIVPIPETTTLNAMSPYGRSKVMSETILSDLCRCKCFMSLPKYEIDYFSAKPNTWRVISLRYFK